MKAKLIKIPIKSKDDDHIYIKFMSLLNYRLLKFYKRNIKIIYITKIKNESLAYNPLRGRIVLHTACDKEVATFAFGQEAQWRNGKDNRPQLYVEGNPVSFNDPSGNNAGKGLMEMFASLISQPISNELLVYATFATGKGGRAARDFALVNLTSQFLAGNFGQEFFLQDSITQQNIVAILSMSKFGVRVGDAFKRVFRSIDHSLKKIARAGDHVSKLVAKTADSYVKDEARRNDKRYKELAKGIAGTARRIAKGMDGGVRWLISGGKFSRNNGNDLDYFYGELGFNTNGFLESIQNSDLGRGLTRNWQSLKSGRCLGLYISGVIFLLGTATGWGPIFANLTNNILAGYTIVSTGTDSAKCLGATDIDYFGR